jgi:hypothetical protein
MIDINLKEVLRVLEEACLFTAAIMLFRPHSDGRDATTVAKYLIIQFQFLRTFQDHLRRPLPMLSALAAHRGSSLERFYN